MTPTPSIPRAKVVAKRVLDSACTWPTYYDLRDICQRLLDTAKELEEAREVLREHHEWHLEAGEMGLQAHDGEWITIDMAGEYCDCLLYQRTQKAIEGLSPDEAGATPRGGMNTWWWQAAILLRRENRKFAEELEHFKSSGIIEVAVRNPNVRDYMEHWEDRATKAEGELETARAEYAELEKAYDEEMEACHHFAGKFADALAHLTTKDSTIARLREVAEMVDAWGHGLRHRTAHESKMVKAARRALSQDGGSHGG